MTRWLEARRGHIGAWGGVLCALWMLSGWSGSAQTPAAPHRIISLVPAATEMLFAIGAGPEVVGVSSFCRYPAEAVSLPKVGSYLRPDTELIARLRPELVFVNAGPNQVERQLTILSTAAVAGQAWQDYGQVIVCDSDEEIWEGSLNYFA